MRTSNARLKTVMDSLVRHLHDFAREVQLTEAEWSHGIDFLTAPEASPTTSRQEFILLSDVLGLSTLVKSMPSGPLGFGELHLARAKS